MTQVVELARPGRNGKLIERLRGLLAEAEAGEIVGAAVVKLMPDGLFGTERTGDCSDLELAGALSFVLHDLIAAKSVTKYTG